MPVWAAAVCRQSGPVAEVLGREPGDLLEYFAEIERTLKAKLIRDLVDLEICLFQELPGLIDLLAGDVFADPYVHMLFEELA